MSNEETSTATDPVEPEPGFIGMVVTTFTQPEEMGASVDRRGVDRRVWTALVLLLVVMMGCAVATLPQMTDLVLTQMKANAQMPKDALEKMEQFFTGPFGKVVLIVQTVVPVALGTLLIAGLLYVGQLLFGGRAGFGRIFGCTVFACLISFGLGMIVRSMLVLAKDSALDVSTGLGIVLGNRPITDPVRAALDFFDLFALWAVWSAGVAISKPATIGRGKGLLISIVVYLLLGGLATVLQIVGSSFGGGS